MSGSEISWQGLADGRVRCLRCGAQHWPCMAPTTERVMLSNGKLGFANCMRPTGHQGQHGTRCACDRKDSENVSQFQKDLKHLINRHSKENGSNTPDFILAQYLVGCLKAFDEATSARQQWWGHDANEHIGGKTGLGAGDGTKPLGSKGAVAVAPDGAVRAENNAGDGRG